MADDGFLQIVRYSIELAAVGFVLIAILLFKPGRGS